jgi:glutamate-ammonia-ligase adenylyltransferase
VFRLVPATRAGALAPQASLPEALFAPVERYWEDYLAAAIAAGIEVPAGSALRETLARVWAASAFVAESCARRPSLMLELLGGGNLLGADPPDGVGARIAEVCARVGSRRELEIALRRARRREMVRIAWRDLAGWSGLEENLRDLSLLAEACLRQAVQYLYAWLSEEWGTPVGSSGERQELVVLGMGKLGARELNFSSDVDLIFAYPEAGQTQGPRPCSNEQFFTRLCRDLIQTLDAHQVEGFVFRVDARLRPYGESGPLVLSFAAMEDYYQHQAREWERYAMVKARPVAGDLTAGEHLMDMLRPFVYRRYLDFGAFESLREMKEMIQREVGRKGLQENIKLGPGGIREVEFVGQVFQLIRGGRDPNLQERAILPVLETLAVREYLPRHVTQELDSGYRFLRRVENRLQQYADRQTHVLPVAESERLRLAVAMGYAGWESFRDALDAHRSRIHGCFDQVFAAPHTSREGKEDPLGAVWLGSLEAAAAERALADAGFGDVPAVREAIERFRGSHAVRTLSERAHRRLNRLLPLLLEASGRSASPDAALQRLFALLERVVRRSAYVALLVENPMVLSQLVQLSAASPWVARHLARYPLLLDELIDPRSLYALLDGAGLARHLDEELSHVEGADLEQQMETLRRFAQANILHVAAADLMGALPLMVVSDHLTEIAEVVLRRVLRLARDYLVARHGEPRCRVGDRDRSAGFAIIAYGKLGGIELGYGSDLDLVFLHDSAGEEQHTVGPRVIDNAVFFARFGQRIVHILNTPTSSGVLYEVDTRLRPSGRAGFLVSGVEAFADYQEVDAWTWEHQALVRARFVAGDESVRRRFEAVRNEVLARPRDPESLRQQVRDMRDRMRGELASREVGLFDLKQGAGGVADIEFVVQYNILLWAHAHGALLHHTDNVRLLATLAEERLMDRQEVCVLTDAYRTYRAAVHRATLQEQPAVVPETAFVDLRREVLRIWHGLMG